VSSAEAFACDIFQELIETNSGRIQI